MVAFSALTSATLVWLIAPCARALEVPGFTINLDLPPQERWVEFAHHFKKNGVIDAWFDFVQVPQMDAERRKQWFDALLPYHDEEILGEIDGFIKVADNVNVTRASILTGMTIYEQQFPMFACSGVLAADENGIVHQGRNMDYNVMLEVNGKQIGWSEVIWEATFERNGKPLFKTTSMFLGFGAHTGMRLGKNGWAFQQNTRVPHGTANHNSDNLNGLRNGGAPFCYTFRRLLENAPDYETAVKEIEKVDLAAPSYFLVSGPKPYQGCAIAKARVAAPEGDLLATYHLSKEKPFFVTTNDDWDKAPYDHRRNMQEFKYSYTSQSEVTADWTVEQMLTMPLHNYATVFGTVMVPATDYYKIMMPWEVKPLVPKVGRLGKNFMKDFVKAARMAEATVAPCLQIGCMMMHALGLGSFVDPPEAAPKSTYAAVELGKQFAMEMAKAYADAAAAGTPMTPPEPPHTMAWSKEAESIWKM